MQTVGHPGQRWQVSVFVLIGIVVLTVRQALSKSGVSGTALPAPYRVFGEWGVWFRQAQLSMIAGIPGACKSMLAMNIVNHWKRPTLYFAADSDERSFAKRLLAVETGQPVDNFEAMDVGTLDAKVAEHLSYIRTSFRAPSLVDVDNNVSAFVELRGEPPAVIVVDNLLNMAQDYEMEFAAMREIVRQLDDLAKDTGAHVMVLHHMSEAGGHPNQIPPQKAVQGKIAQLPRLILGLAKDPQLAMLNVAPLKNTHGRSSPSGMDFMQLSLHEPTMFIGEG